MAGIKALVNNGSNPWYICPNGEIIEPMDVLLCLFPNEGRTKIADNACFVGRPFHLKLLQNMLPSPSDYYTPEHLVDAVISLMIMSAIISVCVLSVKEVWKHLDRNFRLVQPSHKMLYVMSNLSKAILLAVLTLSPRYWVGFWRIYNDRFQGIEVKRCGILYVATDFVALFLVPKLPRSTQFHHVATTVMVLVVASVDMQVPGWNGLLGVTKMCTIYAFFSSIAFPVNAYLGLRVVYPKAKWMPALVQISLWTYVLCCAFNWGLHLAWLWNLFRDCEFSVFPVLYLVAIYIFVHDDIVLIKWLVKRGSPMTEKRVKKKVSFLEDTKNN